jgi:hypothetical protein
MNQQKTEAEIHAMISSKVNSFIDANSLKRLTAREDWEDVSEDEDAKKIVTPELVKRLEFKADGEGQVGFICAKDGKIGVLVEHEYATSESDDDDETLRDIFGAREIPNTPQQIVQCAFDAIQLQNKHPDAEFFVTEGSQNWSRRVCLCVFIPEDAKNRDEILADFNRYSETKVDQGIVKQVFGDKLETLSSYFQERKETFLQSYTSPSL